MDAACITVLRPAHRLLAVPRSMPHVGLSPAAAAVPVAPLPLKASQMEAPCMVTRDTHGSSPAAQGLTLLDIESTQRLRARLRTPEAQGKVRPATHPLHLLLARSSCWQAGGLQPLAGALAPAPGQRTCPASSGCGLGVVPVATAPLCLRSTPRHPDRAAWCCAGLRRSGSWTLCQPSATAVAPRWARASCGRACLAPCAACAAPCTRSCSRWGGRRGRGGELQGSAAPRALLPLSRPHLPCAHAPPPSPPPSRAAGRGGRAQLHPVHHQRPRHGGGVLPRHHGHAHPGAPARDGHRDQAGSRGRGGVGGDAVQGGAKGAGAARLAWYGRPRQHRMSCAALEGACYLAALSCLR